MMFSLPYPNPAIRSRRPKNRKNGFTAVEVVIGAVLMTMLITSMLHVIKQGTYLVELARDHTRVTQSAYI